MDCLLQKGLFARSPYVPYPKQIDFVQETSFIHDIFGKKRPLQTIVCLNQQRNAIGQQLLIAFKQTAKSDDVKAYMDEGIKLSSSLMETFASLLKEDDLIPPSYSGLGVTDSPEAPFSEKLMLSLMTSLNKINYRLDEFFQLFGRAAFYTFCNENGSTEHFPNDIKRLISFLRLNAIH
ncbi:DUF3231 family protein [Paenibacillus cremeus]|uniref:DUF3231 family protein n=1 Tax=Paenibacillus cremeus TaxID=2163881 RepID=A0A559K7F2_9BACL|nr:DUF3231 family protein [Paenibacillus cremeus]